jgi:hypothetical protein
MFLPMSVARHAVPTMVGLSHHGVVADLMSEIVVVNDSGWLGNPRFGGFTVAIDGRRVGRAPLHEELRCPVAPGTHTVRVRQWHYKSPRFAVQVLPGAPTVLRANKPAGPVWKAMLRLALRPFHSLSLEPDTRPLGQPRAPTELDAAARSRRQRALLIYAVGMALFFVAALVLTKLIG